MEVKMKDRKQSEKMTSASSVIVSRRFIFSLMCVLCALVARAAGSEGQHLRTDEHYSTWGSVDDGVSSAREPAPALAVHSQGPSPNFKSLSVGESWRSYTHLKPLLPAEIVSSCAAFIDYFGDLAANFTKCVVQFARPLRVCDNCVAQYFHANSAYQIVMKGKHHDEHGELCGDMILNSDRIQVIVRTALFIDKLWMDCNCKNCFDVTEGKNGSVKYRLSNDTIKFHNLAFQTEQCFQNNSRIEPSGNRSLHNTSEVCENCGVTYRQLNSLYYHLEEASKHHLCIDIVDAMNSTRLQWSKGYGCSAKMVDLTPVFVLSGIFCLLPIVFYVGNRLHSTKVQKTIMKQHRVRDTISPDPHADAGNDDSS